MSCICYVKRCVVQYSTLDIKHAWRYSWYDLKSIAEFLCLNNKEDFIIWKFESKGVYSVSSLYAVVNFRGVILVHISVVWRIKVQPRVHVFIWLLANNRLLTRDNLVKRQHVPIIVVFFALRLRL
jgi:hypothetical protein